MSYYTEISSSAGLKLEPDTSPYTGTILGAAPSIIDGMWDVTTNVADWDPSYSYGVDLGSAQDIDRLFLCLDRSGTWRGSDWATFSVYKSDDNSSWTLVQTFYSPTLVWRADNSLGVNLDLTTTQTARYFKIVNSGAYCIQTSDAGYYDCEVGQIIAYKEEYGSDPNIRLGVANYWALDPDNTHADLTLSNGNLTITNTVDARRTARTIKPLPSSGKWYWEVTLSVANGCTTSEGRQRKCVGVGTYDAQLSETIGYNAVSWAVATSGHGIYDSSLVGVPGSLMYFCKNATTYNHVIGVAYDAATKSLWFRWHIWGSQYGLGDPVAGTNALHAGINGTVYPMLSLSKSGDQMSINFGASDFTYYVPTGFTALGEAYPEAVGTVATWNPDDIGSNITLSVDFLTATHA